MTLRNFQTYDKGDVVRCSGVFKNLAGVIIDPAVVKFSFIDPVGTETTYVYLTDAALHKDTDGSKTGLEGSYYSDIDADICGTYQWRLFATGTGKAAEQWKFFVQFTDFT